MIATKPLIVKGERWMRIRPETVPLGLGMAVRMWIVTDARSRKRIGHRHLSRAAAAHWVTDQGWRYLGSQESET